MATTLRTDDGMGMNALFLCAALALPSAMPYHSKPLWTFSQDEVKVIQILRDWPNGYTGSRPRAWVLIYGRHPHWMLSLKDAGVKVVGMYHELVHYPGYVRGSPVKAPFRTKQFQVYIYDYFPFDPVKIVQEASRIIADYGFFLYRYTKNGIMAEALNQFGWQRFDLDFHEFTIWCRPKDYEHIELTTSIILRSA